MSQMERDSFKGQTAQEIEAAVKEIRSKPDELAADFQELYWKGPLISGGTLWFGYPCIKSPFDLWTYQEIIYETRPDLIVETGTLAGGSALYLAHMLDQMGKGEVITIDIAPYPGLPEHDRITYFNGDSVGEKMLAKVTRRAEGKRVMVILDSDHSYEHVSAELKAYHPLVSPGCYLVVEDTWGPLGFGAAQAAGEFVEAHEDFAVDLTRERHLMTFHPSGFLKRHA